MRPNELPTNPILILAPVVAFCSWNPQVLTAIASAVVSAEATTSTAAVDSIKVEKAEVDKMDSSATAATDPVKAGDAEQTAIEQPDIESVEALAPPA